MDTKTKKVAAAGKGVTPERLVDLTAFYIGYAAFVEWMEETGGTKDSFTQRGDVLARRHLPTLDDAVVAHVEPLTQRDDATRIKAPYKRFNRSGSPSERAVAKAGFLKLLFGWLRTHQTQFRAAFAGKSRKAGMSVMRVADEDNLASVVRGAAAIPAVSGLQAPRKWLAAAAERMGAPLSEAEEVMGKVESVANLAADAKKLDTRIAAADPGSDKAAELSAEKAAILAKMSDHAEGDKGVLQAGAAAAFVADTGHATRTGQKLSLNAQQEAAMMATGRKVIAAGAGSGKCVVGDTLIQTELGFIPIGELGADLPDEMDFPLALGIHGVDGPEKTSHVYYDGVRATRRVETCQGYEIEGTGAHRVLALRSGKVDWVTLAELSEGDVLCIDRRPGLFAEQPFKRPPDDPSLFRTNATPETNIPLELTPQVASLLGWIVSEGYIRSNQWNISLTTTEPEQRNAYLAAMSGLVTPTESEDNRNTKQYVLNFHRSADIRALLGFGLTRTLAGEKEVPAGILRSPRPVVRAFLRSLFDGDGGVTSNTVEYCTASTVLAKQVHTLLAAFGIPCRKKFRPNKGQGAWHLVLSGLGLRTFNAEIGFGIQPKADRLSQLVQRDANTNIDVIRGISDICRTVKDQYAKQFGTTRTKDEGYGTFKCLVNGSRNPSYATLRGFLKFYPVEGSTEWVDLDTLCKSKWFFDPVLEKTEHVAPVYDFVVPGTHSFSANGFINHNTRVLAGEVAYRINELGYDAAAICGVSFTRDSSKEFVRRITKYGAVIDGAAKSGFGTTHYLAGVTILGKLGKSQKRPNYFSKNQNWAVTSLVALAVRQVSMKGPGGEAPQPKNLFTDKPSIVPETVEQAEVPEFGPPPVDEGEKRAFLDALNRAADFFEYGWPANWKGGDWARNSLDFLSGLGRAVARDGMNPADIEGWKRDKLLKLMERAKVPAPKFANVPRTAAVGEEADADVPSAGKAKAERKGMKKYQYFDTPAGMWFNLGHKWEGAGDKKGKEGEQFSAAAVKRKIDIWKGLGATPEEVWYAAGPAAGKEKPYAPEAAAYAAYEWLKGSRGEPDFRNTGDMNDLLIDATRTLVHDKRARTALQTRFKVILVDEAQDLNRTQHVLFSLLAGAIDHETLEPHADGRMTADTFGFIGDDKQAIYEFRGAEPDEFIDKSDIVPGGQDYETHLLDTNYRSGQAIVEAANQLIKHNEKQIPMTCKANYEVKGDGAITAESFGDPEGAADMVAETVAEYAEANATSDAKYSNYGIAVRSNAEAMHYALGMVKKAIPFKAKVNPFKSPPTKAMLGWMSLAKHGGGLPDMPKAAFLSAVKDSLRMPSSFLGKAFTNRLEKESNPARWLLTIRPEDEFRSNYSRNVKAYIENLRVCIKFDATMDPEQVYSALLVELKNSGGQSFFESIVENIKENNDKMAELAADNPDGIPTDEQITEAAEEDLVLLTGLMGSKDSVGGVMGYVDELKAVNEKVAAGADDDRDAVTIGTMHSWKGLEVPKMYIPMVRGKFPRVSLEKDPNTGELKCTEPAKDDPALASERRLAYVAITRAEDSCVMMDIFNPSPAFADCPPSQFISESCVRFAGEAEAAVEDDENDEPAVFPPDIMASTAVKNDPMVTAWDMDQGHNWHDGPTDDEAAEMDLVKSMGDMTIDEPQPEEDPEDEMLAMWFKTTGND